MKEFCRICEIPYTTMQNYILEKRGVGTDALVKINTHLNVDLTWLLTGEGAMYRQTETGVETMKAANDAPPERAISEREWALVQMLRKMPENEQVRMAEHLHEREQFREMQERLEKLERKTA